MLPTTSPSETFSSWICFYLRYTLRSPPPPLPHLVAFTGIKKPILIWDGHQSVGLLVQHTLLKVGEIRLLRCFSVCVLKICNYGNSLHHWLLLQHSPILFQCSPTHTQTYTHVFFSSKLRFFYAPVCAPTLSCPTPAHLQEQLIGSVLTYL